MVAVMMDLLRGHNMQFALQRCHLVQLNITSMIIMALNINMIISVSHCQKQPLGKQVQGRSYTFLTTKHIGYQIRKNGVMSNSNRSEERRVGKECRSRWSPYH